MKLQGKNIFLMGTSRFDGPDQSTSFNIATRLAEHNTIYYIDYPFTWKDLFSLIGTKQLKIRFPFFFPFSSGILKSGTNGLNFIICPPLLSINFLPEGKIYRFFLSINEAIIRRRLRKIIRQNRLKDHIYINSFNFHYPGVAKGLKSELTVYHCVDPMIMPYDIKHGVISENRLVKESDLIICTSKKLCDDKKLLNSNTFFIPNAADITHSTKALDKTLPVHKSLQRFRKPVVGYAGSIERRLDYELIVEVAKLNPQISFVFAGPVNPEFVPGWFFDTENIFLLGRVPFNEVPQLIKGFDIAIIPFKADNVSATIFPLKLFEYLGAGRPVIATDFNPDLEEFTNGTVSFCTNAENFSEAIKNLLANDSEELQKQRIEIARQNTWERRAGEIAKLIADNLKPKP